MTTACTLDSLSDDARRRLKFYCVVAVSMYVTSAIVSVVVLVCGAYQVIDYRFVGAGAVLPVITRHLVGFIIGPRIASVTGAPMPKASIVGSLVTFGLVGAFILLPWL